MKTIKVTNPKDAGQWVKLSTEKHPVLSEMSMFVFRGAIMYILVEKELPISFNVTYIGKRKKNVWEPYANWYSAYTVTPRRREGHAKKLATEVRNEAISLGCRRLKSLAGTYLGLVLHESFGDQFWGIRENMEVIIDTPLVDMPEYSTKPPPTAITKSKMSLKDVLKELGDRKLRYERTK